MEARQDRGPIERAIAMLANDLPHMPATDACARLAWLKRQAILEGYLPTAMLADGLSRAIAREGSNAPFGAWIDALVMAAGFGIANTDTAPLLLATVGVRFAN